LNRKRSVIEIFCDLQLLGTIFAALLGSAFGSFLNVFLARFPEGESIVTPRSHCRHCEHILAWWENLPLLSWILLRGRCRCCRHSIGLRYPMVEVAVALLWTLCWLRFIKPLFASGFAAGGASGFANREIPHLLAHCLIQVAGYAVLCWLLVALAALDAEHFWLPDWLTLPGIAAGFLFALLATWSSWYFDQPANVLHAAWRSALAILASGGLILFIRLAYWLVRRQEGIGLGDAKLMAMLGAWFGLRGALEAFMLAAFLASAAAILWLAVLTIRRKTSGWSQMPLPLGTFLCIAGLVEVFYPNWLLNSARLGF
jgi:leader peptidase (prepilin peptidase) / N-methyltransferase